MRVCFPSSAMRWAHLEQFREYFGDTKANQWVGNPFIFPAELRDGLSIQEEEALLDLSSNMELQQKIREVSLAHFWLSVETEFPSLSVKAMQVLIPFLSTYLCECGFSALTLIKTK